MHTLRAFTISLLTAFALCLTSREAPGAAAPMPPASALIKVNHCSAALNVSQTTGWAGYTPGWYGGYYRDPWGYRYYQPMYGPTTTTTFPELAIDFVNISPKVMKEIQFGLIANGILKAEARDVGTFSPHVEIKHKFRIPESTFPISTGLPQCVPLEIEFEDGTKWMNPHLPPKNQQIYLNPGH